VAEARQALLITSSVYDDPQLHALATPRRDAAVLRDVLKDSRIGGFAVERVTNPTSSRAAERVEAFFAERDWDDFLLLYFSGHGLKSDGGDLFFAMRNTVRSRLRTTSLSAGLVHEIMSTSDSQRKVLLLDCCYGGAIKRELTKADVELDVIERMQGFGTVVLTASNELEFAWQEGGSDDDPRESVFTGIVAEGLRTGDADLDGDGQISVLELHRYASQRVRALGTAQTPTLSAVGQEGELVIARAPQVAAASSAQAAEPLRGLVELAKADDFETRLGAVAALTSSLDSDDTARSGFARTLLEQLQDDGSFLVADAARVAVGEYERRLEAHEAGNASIGYYETEDFRRNQGRVQPIPAPRLTPSRLSLEDVIGAAACDRITAAGKISFHVISDTGHAQRVNGREVRHLPAIVKAMAGELRAADEAGPAFCFHLGDIVLHFGEARYYRDQFYEPFRAYDRPIFAIPGNHDGMVTGDDGAPPSLEAFVDNFCAAASSTPRDAAGSARKTMTQPGVYFTVDAPFISIIGLYTNVLEGPGVISSQGGRYPLTDDQLVYLTSELTRLKTARAANERAVIIACHHPVVSAGRSGGGSAGLGDDLDTACRSADLWPDAVLAGHVRSYQRFTRTHKSGQIPYLVAGTGARAAAAASLRSRAPITVGEYTLTASPIAKEGYLTISVEMKTAAPHLTISFRAGGKGTAKDSVTVDLAARRLVHPPQG
jgi:hypothetical protein